MSEEKLNKGNEKKKSSTNGNTDETTSETRDTFTVKRTGRVKDEHKDALRMPEEMRMNKFVGSEERKVLEVVGSTEDTSRLEEEHSYYEGSPCNQTLTDIESLPLHFVADSKPKRRRACRCPHCCPEPQAPTHRSLNRYNKNHVQICKSPEYGLAWWNHKNWCWRKKKYKLKKKHDCSGHKHGKTNTSTESGETVPQLYKAKIKQHLSKVPEMFKFHTVSPSSIHRYINVAELKHTDKKCYQNECVKNKCCGNKCERMTLGHYGNEEKIYLTSKSHHRLPLLEELDDQSDQIAVRKISNDTPNVNLRARLNFDGTEYISTNELPHRIDIYCFDHLNTSYFRTTDQPPPLLTDEAMQKAEEMATRFWAEIFGFFHLFIALVTAFILQLYKFLLFSIVRPLVTGLCQLTSDYLIKPLLTIIYNGFTQPLMVFVFNLATSFRDICLPIARGLGYFITEFSNILRAIRLVELNRIQKQPQMKDSSC